MTNDDWRLLRDRVPYVSSGLQDLTEHITHDAQSAAPGEVDLRGRYALYDGRCDGVEMRLAHHPAVRADCRQGSAKSRSDLEGHRQFVQLLRQQEQVQSPVAYC